MPKNLTGGNKAKGRANGESDKLKKNRRLIEDLFADLQVGEDLTGVHVGRVTKKFGFGRMEVFYVEDTKAGPQIQMLNCPLRGGMRGKGKKDVWVDIDSVVVLGNTGVPGSSEYEIIAVLTPDQCRHLSKINPSIDKRILAKENNDADELFEFGKDKKKADEDEIDLETI